jgi:predicted nucleic acid-binding protein
MNADKLLIDELAGRAEAERRKLHVTGTLGVFADAYVAGLVDFDRALARLPSTNFRIFAEVERLVRRPIAAEKSGP